MNGAKRRQIANADLFKRAHRGSARVPSETVLRDARLPSSRGTRISESLLAIRLMNMRRKPRLASTDGRLCLGFEKIRSYSVLGRIESIRNKFLIGSKNFDRVRKVLNALQVEYFK